MAVVFTLFSAASAFASVRGGGFPSESDSAGAEPAPVVQPARPVPAVAADVLPTPPATNDRVSLNAAGAQINGTSGGVTDLITAANANQAISADGRWVAFVSLGGLFIRDRLDETTISVPFIDGGAIPAGFIPAEPALSADGGVVAFTVIVTVPSSQLFVASSEPTPYVLAWDRKNPASEVVSFDDAGRAATGYQPTISGDGRYVAYTRWAPPAPPTAPPTPTPRPNNPPTISGLTATPTCVEDSDLDSDGEADTSTIRVHASDPDGDPLTLRIQLHWIDPERPANHFFRFPAAMRFAGGDEWTFIVTAADLRSFGWTGGAIHYDVTARDQLGLDSATLHDDPAPSSNSLYYAPGGCVVLL